MKTGERKIVKACMIVLWKIKLNKSVAYLVSIGLELITYSQK